MTGLFVPESGLDWLICSLGSGPGQTEVSVVQLEELVSLLEQALVSSFILSSLELSDTQVYEPCTRALLGTAGVGGKSDRFLGGAVGRVGVECGTYKTVNARFWPWLSGEGP